jgi:hypothetical protein
MKKKGMILCAVILLCVAGSVQAQEELGVELDVTWVSKYIWRGFDVLDDKAAVQPSVNLDLFGTGFSAMIWASYSTTGGTSSGVPAGRVNATEYDYVIKYDASLSEGEMCQLDMTANYIYYDFIDEPTKAADAQELGVGFSMPNICAAGFVPRYYVGKIWASRSDSWLVSNYGGWVHVLGVGYDMAIPGILPDTPEQILKLGADVTYNDGYAGANSDWSHATFSIAAPMPVGAVKVTPALYYQSSWEDTVNSEDELYCGLSVAYNF